MKNKSVKKHSKLFGKIVAFLMIAAIIVSTVALQTTVSAQDSQTPVSTEESAAETEPVGTEQPEVEEQEQAQPEPEEPAVKQEESKSEPEQEESEPEQEEPAYVSGKLSADTGKDASISVQAEVGENALLPENVQLAAKEVTKESDYNSYRNKLTELLNDQGYAETDYSVDDVRFFDIGFAADGKEVEPSAKVKVTVSFDPAVEVGDGQSLLVYHIDDSDDKYTWILDEKNDGLRTDIKDGKLGKVTFESDRFSVYGVVVVQKRTGSVTLPAAENDDCRATITYERSRVTDIPENASVSVKTISEDSSDYSSAVDLVAQARKAEDPDFDKDSIIVKAVDISILGPDGTEIEPDGPVNVKIEMKEMPEDVVPDSVEVQHIKEAQDTEAETVADTGNATEGSVDVKENSVVADFSVDSFSTFAVTAQRAGSADYTVEVGKTITIKASRLSDGKKGNTYDWSSSDKSIAAVSGSTESAAVTGVAPGTVTITLKHGYKEKQKDPYSYETKTYTVLVTSSETVTDADATATSGNSDPTVTVKDTGNLKKLSGYHVVVENADSEYKEDDNFLKAYDIYLADEEGNKVSSSELMNGTLNLQVTLTYSTLPDWFNQVKSIKHFDNSTDRKEQWINNVKTDSAARTISFQVHGFSDFVISSSSSSTTGGGTEITTEGGSILDGMSFNDANEWQIVSNEYSGNAASNKTASSDGKVRVQKNVIPTGTENEFYVYLSIDRKETEIRETDYQEYFRKAQYNATTSNNFHANQLGTIVDYMTGNEGVQVSGEYHSDWRKSNFTIKDPNGNTLASNVTLYWSQANNVTFEMKLGDGRYVLMGLSIKNDSTTEVALSTEAWDEIKKEITSSASFNKTDLKSVTDTLGEDFEFVETVKADGSVTESNGTLTWSITPKTSYGTYSETVSEGNATHTKTTTETWDLNVAELLYKVKYTPKTSAGLDTDTNKPETITDPTASDNTATGEADVNQSAALTYDTDSQVTFPQPEVRGMLYELKVKKVDSKTKEGLDGAEFELYTDKDCKNAVTDSSSKTLTAKSENGGYVDIKDLQYGTYYLKEVTPPSKHKITNEISGPYTVCYTTDSGSLKGQGYGSDALYKMAAGTDIEITNDPIEDVYLKIVKVDSAGTDKVLQGARFSVSSDVTDFTSATWTSNEQGVVYNGKLSDGTYTLTETEAPGGYRSLNGSFNITVDADGTTKISLSKGSGDTIDDPALQDANAENSESNPYVIYVHNSSVPLTAIYHASDGTKILLTLIALVIIAGGGFYLRKRRAGDL